MAGPVTNFPVKILLGTVESRQESLVGHLVLLDPAASKCPPKITKNG